MDKEARSNRPVPGRLLRTPKPQPDESLAGFILRVSEKNGYETPLPVIQLGGFNRDEYYKNCSFVYGRPSSFARIACLTGVEVADLAALGYPPTPSGEPALERLFFTSPVSKIFIRGTYNKICPLCLRESNYCRKAWELAGVTACPLHKLLLLDECPNCHRRITWKRKGVSVCACGSDFRDADARPVEESELILARQIYRLCGLLRFEAEPEDVANNPLAGLPLKDILSVIFLIVGEYQNAYGTKGQQILKRQRNAEAHTLLTKAFAVFEQWPRNYFEFLTWRRQPDVNPNARSAAHTGVLKDFGKFYERLHDQFKATRYDFLRVALDEYLSRHWDGGYIGFLRRFKGAPLSSRGDQYVPGMAAVRELGVVWRCFIRYVETGELKAVVRYKGKKTLYLVDAESLRSLKREFERSLGMREVADRMGVRIPTLDKIVRQGIIKALRGPAADGTAVWRFNEGVVDDLFERIRATIPTPGSAIVGDELSLYAAFERIRNFARSLFLAQLITAILNREIVPCGETAEGGLYRFLFKPNVVEAYARTMSRTGSRRHSSLVHD